MSWGSKDWFIVQVQIWGVVMSSHVWHGWGHTSLTWPIQLTADSTTNSYSIECVSLGGKSRLERLEEADQEVHFREHLIEREGFTDQDLFVIYKMNGNRLEFITFGDQDLSMSHNHTIGAGAMIKEETVN
ncbi:unnamed protein product [Rotaria magnacalcarata]|uniref:Uncharacterized protein n=1 Tax=Rotaria magnacalcarata TaxID=392030 RepID=A0A816PBN6_9BILA|nr:unnamed protein product [Rotaria magnacalcarata]CAF1614231.1 unnamed protein product [Rotaria magnacalcarata]CAF1914723.1 unnamed protein product [Rotaria magnacalcarata]CAF2046552.1 unnamed protein product [Rotaria magnacalcarata]CAF2056369.1 unnamed protein product [Rotaria magnacalcarata]